MLTELCQELKNWFVHEKHDGTFSITGGNITADFLQNGQYFRIMGSIFSDGVHQFPCDDLPPETFTGAVWTLAIPASVIKLSTEIESWRGKYEAADSAAMSPFSSESFGGYSYSKGSANSSESNGGVSWQNVFKAQLNRWRKI